MAKEKRHSGMVRYHGWMSGATKTSLRKLAAEESEKLKRNVSVNELILLAVKETYGI